MATEFLKGDPIAVTGSPNTVRKVHFDVRHGHLDAPLVGALVAFETRSAPVPGVDRHQVHVGQVTEATTRNRWHEDPSYKDYLKRNGRLASLTGDADVTEGTLQVIGTYQRDGDGWTKVTSTTPVGTGRDVRRMDPGTVRSLMERERGYVFIGEFLGNADGTPPVPAPVFTRHFGPVGDDGNGAGEAFIGGVFGPAGSGKTVFAVSLATLWARHDRMGMLFIDPQGELRANSIGGGTGFGYDFHGQLERATGGRFDRNGGVIDIDQITLSGTELFVRVLWERKFFDKMVLGGTKAAAVRQALVEGLEGLREEEKAWETHRRWSQMQAVALSPRLFADDDDEEAEAGPKGRRSRPRVERDFAEWIAQTVMSVYAGERKADQVRAALANGRTGRIWDEVADMFDERVPGRHKLDVLVRQVLVEGKVVVVDLNSQGDRLSEELRNDVLLLVFQKVTKVAQEVYRSRRGGTNAMIVLDEASLFIPQTSDDDRIRSISKDLGEKAKMLRKLSVGMLLMTQRISGIRQEIYAQMHFRAYGAGLAMGGDAEAIRSMEGAEAFKLYSDLPDPKLSGAYSFMIAGALVALGSSGEPMFVRGFRDGDALMDANASFLPVSNVGSRGRASKGTKAFAGILDMT